MLINFNRLCILIENADFFLSFAQTILYPHIYLVFNKQ